MTTVKVVYTDKKGDEITLFVPSKFEVCHDCNGEGRVLTESIRYAVYDQNDFNFDPEFAAEYFKGGHGIYGVPCSTCNSLRVVAVPDWEASEPAIYKHKMPYLRSLEIGEREAEADRRTMMMECGYSE